MNIPPDRNAKWTRHEYGFSARHPSLVGIAAYVLVVLPIPALHSSLTSQPINSSTVLFIVIFGCIIFVIGLWREVAHRRYFEPIFTNDLGIRFGYHGRIYPWCELRAIEPFNAPHPDFYITLSAGFKVEFPDGNSVRIFEKISDYNQIKNHVVEQSGGWETHQK